MLALYRTELSDRLAVFEAICRAAEVGVESSEPGIPCQVPPSMIAATSGPKRGGLPVVVEVGARRVVAVVEGGHGDEQRWVPVIAAAAAMPPPAAQVTKIERASMPDGLIATAAIPPAGGGLAVKVADALATSEATRAVLTAARAARRNGWRGFYGGVWLPVAAASIAWRFAAIPAKAAIAGATAVTATAAGLAIAVLPGHAIPGVSIIGAPQATPSATAQPRDHDRARQRHNRAVVVVPARPATARTTSPAGHELTAAQPHQRSTQAPEPGVSSAQPSPSPTSKHSASPSPSPSSTSTGQTAGTGICAGLLILNVCVPL